MERVSTAYLNPAITETCAICGHIKVCCEIDSADQAAVKYILKSVPVSVVGLYSYTGHAAVSWHTQSSCKVFKAAGQSHLLQTLPHRQLWCSQLRLAGHNLDSGRGCCDFPGRRLPRISG